MRREMAIDPYYKTCARSGLHGHTCEGRITWEHALVFSGRRLNGKPFIIPICTKAHAVDFHQDGGDMNKEINVWIALNRATDQELRNISKAIDYIHKRAFLNAKYGVYKQPVLENNNINY